MKPSIYKLKLFSNGSLYIMPKPSGEWLEEDMTAYAVMGINKIVSLLENAEAAELGLTEQGLFCNKHGIVFVQQQIQDRGLPAVEIFDALVKEICRDLNKGLDVAVHCRAGIGRSGVLACCVMIHENISAEMAVSEVSRARGVTVPDTDEQLNFILEFSKRS